MVLRICSKYFEQDYQLLHDVPTRWSSTLNSAHFLNTFLLIKTTGNCDDITSDNEFKDLHKFKLTEEDWNLLKDYQEILQVTYCFLLMKYVNITLLGSPCIPGDLWC